MPLYPLDLYRDASLPAGSLLWTRKRMPEALAPGFFLTQWRPVPPVTLQSMMAVFTISLSKLLLMWENPS